MTRHVYAPGEDGFCGVCQESATYCAGSRPIPRGDNGDSAGTPIAAVVAAGQRPYGDSRDSRDTRPGPRTSWTAAELMATDFPEPRWAVPGIVAEGVTVLAGAPKVGKSWLGLGLGVATATGGKALGSIDVQAGPALYLALEDTGRRLKDRLGKVLGPSPAPVTLTLATVCPPLPSGGDELISSWLDRNGAARLVVIDVLARVRGPASRDLSPYEADYRAVCRAKAIADHYGVPFVIVHHTRKASAADFLDEVSGTQGVAGAADTVLVLKRMRGRADAILHVTGREVEETSLALTFAADIGAWQLSAVPASEVILGDTRMAVLAYIREHEGARPKQVSDDLGLDYELTKKTCKRMDEDGQLDTDGRGRYFAPLSAVPAVPAVPAAGQSTDADVPALSPLSLDSTQPEE
jgi:AAA domain-containing protein